MNYINFALWLTCLINVLLIFYDDIRYRIVKHRFLLIIFITSLLSLFFTPEPLTQLAVSTSVFICFFILWLINIVGGGDVKLIGALFLGVNDEYMLAAIVAIGLLGGIQILVMWLMSVYRKKTPFENGIPYTIPIGISGLIFFYMSLI
ncbi:MULTISPECIES: A24 family peptidase [Vibrio]|uniref:A24 family peptidase n=1 Tax=Vibrio TaxID=662 RepID=UPI00084AC152|nr:A24 family peptidase [Vibrio parahaemolyticus]MBO0154978.1 prepilin peptidase [Vibrio parahaemolyticus]MBO0185735.1 prepilin peptidase [Vibrio parahaemolyticus]MBO0195535.1 prepilin peptidase [Vibrio parahaemolyticus]MDF4578240.1 A24 family peptidase [Vibrio parahaemolyticus]MDF5168733.1 A24 family peptidase [Vibrio parahaemolyticus]